jgi:hypothetical protein
MSNPDYNEEARKLFSALNLPASGAASGLRLLASLCVETIACGRWMQGVVGTTT